MLVDNGCRVFKDECDVVRPGGFSVKTFSSLHGCQLSPRTNTTPKSDMKIFKKKKGSRFKVSFPHI